MSTHYTVIVDVKEVTTTPDPKHPGSHIKDTEDVGKIVLRGDTKEDVLAKVGKALEAL